MRFKLTYKKEAHDMQNDSTNLHSGRPRPLLHPSAGGTATLPPANLIPQCTITDIYISQHLNHNYYYSIYSTYVLIQEWSKRFLEGSTKWFNAIRMGSIIVRLIVFLRLYIYERLFIITSLPHPLFG